MNTDTVSSERLSAVRRLRLALLIFIHVMILVASVHAAARNTRDGTGYLIAIMLACAAVMACVNDARVRGKPILPIVQFLMLFVWPVSVILYLIASRGWRGILWALLWTATALSCTILGSVGTWLVQKMLAS